MDAETLLVIDKVEEQITGLYEEVSLLSKKKPDGPVNKFKVKM